MRKHIINENQFKSIVKRMVNESLKRIYENYYFEESEEESDDNDKDTERKNKRDARNHTKDDNNGPSGESEKSRRRRIQIEEYLNQPGVNTAQYFYTLFGVKPTEGNDTNDMKNARSLGEKKLHHEENTEGYEYYFTSEEVNQLFSIISGNELS